MSNSLNKVAEGKDETQIVISKLVKLCKVTNDKYPSGTDYKFFCSYPTFNEQSNNLSNNVLTLLNKLCNFANPKQTDIDLISEKNEYLRWQQISDSADHCIENVDMCLDQIKEQSNNQSLHNGRASKRTHSSSNKQNKLFSGEIHDNNCLELLYPQKAFLELIDNKRNTPFKPDLINGKPNSQKPFILELIGDDDDKHYGHPYRYEIEHIQYDPEQLMHRKEEEYTSIDSTLLYWIDTEDALYEMAEILSCCKAIAVDLEHHTKYTFSGMTCLIQISSRNRDYIIDALELRECIHMHLNPLFTNPNIVKVLHGCMNDIQWLQRDFSVYIVNLFDSFEAAKLLKLKQKSLKYLLKTYCDVDTNKELRKTDWRVRPLRPELIDYARKDTHYLLYIYDHLTNVLKEESTKHRDLLMECYNNCEKQCLIRYEKPRFDSKGWQYLCQKKGWYFIDNKSLNALSKLYEWRDRIARDLDQSVDGVLSDTLLKQMVKDLPQNESDIPQYILRNLSIIARKYMKDILDIIKQSVDSIDPMLEVINNGESNNDNSDDLNTICCSNDGCFEAVLNETFMDTMDIDEENNALQYDKAETSFFAINDDIRMEDDTQRMVDGIFNEICNEPIFNRKRQDCAPKKVKKRTRRQCDTVSNNKTQKRVKTKRNNVNRVANAGDRGKIFGSRYLDTNSKKDVFALPRDNKNSKKRKGKDVDMDGPVLEDIPRSKKKRKLSKYVQKQQRLKRDRQKKRRNKTTAVEDEWEVDETVQEKGVINTNDNNKNKNKNKDQEYKKSDKDGEEHQDMEITETDILDAAPVPVLDTKFENVYDPFKSNDY